MRRIAVAAAVVLVGCSHHPTLTTVEPPGPSHRPYRDLDTPRTTTTTLRTTTTRASRSTVATRRETGLTLPVARSEGEALPQAAPERTSPTPAAVSCGEWRELLAGQSWPLEKACRVMMCESGGNPDAIGERNVVTVNGVRRVVYPHGLFQVLDGSFDPETNVVQAAAKWAARGWQPWPHCGRS